MEKYIPIVKPDINDSDINELTLILKSGNLVQGKKVKELESFTSKYTKSKYAISLNSGTATLHLSLISLGVKEGDEVIVPAFSYIATANVVELVGAKPILLM